MTLEQDFQAQLATITALTTIVGGNIYPVALPKGVDALAAPWMTYEVVSHTELYAISADSYALRNRIALNIWSVAYSDVVTARKAIRAALAGFQGTFPGGTPIQLVQVANESDSFESTSLLYRSMIQLLITYVDTNP